ncbi:hypothetical protein BDD12DRAFT_881889 [Trichophaea hybrida]|nr:hypothetical protein BDD12DRAFT_881889 [Trichophaea hybrida]
MAVNRLSNYWDSHLVEPGTYELANMPAIPRSVSAPEYHFRSQRDPGSRPRPLSHPPAVVEKLDEYHQFLNALNAPKESRQGHIYDVYGNSQKTEVKVHPGNAWFFNSNVGTLHGDEEDRPENVLGVKAPRIWIEDIPGQRLMKKKKDVVKMAKAVGWSKEQIEAFGDTIMESDLMATPDGWDYAINNL